MTQLAVAASAKPVQAKALVPLTPMLVRGVGTHLTFVRAPVDPRLEVKPRPSRGVPPPNPNVDPSLLGTLTFPPRSPVFVRPFPLLSLGGVVPPPLSPVILSQWEYSQSIPQIPHSMRKNAAPAAFGLIPVLGPPTPPLVPTPPSPPPWTVPPIPKSHAMEPSGLFQKEPSHTAGQWLVLTTATAPMPVGSA